MVTRQAMLPVGYVALFLSACSSAPGSWNSLRSLRATQAVEQKSAELSKFLGNIQRIQIEIDAARSRSRELEIELSKQREAGRDKSLELGERLATLRAMEQDLAAAGARSGEIDKELSALRILEQRYAERSKLSQELEGKIKTLDQSLAPLAAAVAAKEAEISARVADLRGRLSKLEAVSGQLGAALKAAEGLLPTPPAPAAGNQQPAGAKKDSG